MEEEAAYSEERQSVAFLFGGEADRGVMENQRMADCSKE